MSITTLCSKRGCREKQPCPNPAHQRNSTRSGYDYRWQKFRKAYFYQYPLCVRCEKLGIVKSAEHLDHINPVTGADDPTFWIGPFQGLCHSHHSQKTAEDQRSR
jgi:5-methylcytosine-specific restriction protein A